MSNIMGMTHSMHWRHTCSTLGVTPEGKKALSWDVIHYEALLNAEVYFHAV